MTLIEIMISMVVGLILLAGILSIFTSNKQAYRIQESTSVLNENARFALNQMQYHLRMSEHWGGVEAENVEIEDTLAALPIVGSCGAGTPTISGIGFTGIESALLSPVDCIDDLDYKPDTDVLIVRYGEPERIPIDMVEISDDVFVRVATGRRAMIHQGNTVTSLPSDLYKPSDPAPDHMANYRYRTVVYFVRRCASQDRGTAGVCDDADDTTPTLTRLVLDDAELVQEDVVAGVEQMQLSYGVLDESGSAPNIEYKTADEITANNEWTEVTNVRVSLVIRGEQRDTTFDDPRDFNLYGGYVYTPDAADRSFRRKLFNFTVQIRNLTRA